MTLPDDLETRFRGLPREARARLGRSAADPQTPAVDLPLRVPVADVSRLESHNRVAGRVETGRVGVGDEVIFSPSNRTARVTAIEGRDADDGATPLAVAEAGQRVDITLEESVVAGQGEVISHVAHAPLETDVFRARLVWLGAAPLAVGDCCTLRAGIAEAEVEVERLERIIEAPDVAAVDPHTIPPDAVADVIFRSSSLLALDPADYNPYTGRFVLVDGNDIVGGGLVDMEGYPDQRQLVTRRSTNLTHVDYAVTDEMRMARNRHRGGVLWFTGLSGAGKSTLAVALEQRLFHKGYQVYILDGDNVRNGLNANLGFSPEDRAENIRRVGEVAALMARAGLIVISAFISPYRSDRERARMAAGNGSFHEVYVAASLDVCEKRDPKGLYSRARAGEIKDFTGISAPYEAPEACEIVIDTGKLDVAQSLDKLVAYVEAYFPCSGGT